MRSRPLLRRWTVNWGLKLSALALAVLLWLMVTTAQVTTRWRTVPVEVVARDPRLGDAPGARPPTVRVRFSGAGRDLWRLGASHPAVVLSISELNVTGLYELEPRMVRLPAGLPIGVLEIRPSMVRVLPGRAVSAPR